MNICTWNMQGSTGSGESKWNTDVKRLFLKANVEIALLQEAGTPPGSANPVMPPVPFATADPMVGGGFAWNYFVWNLGTLSRPFNVHIYWVKADVGGNRCNLAIAFTVPPSALLFCRNPIPPAPGSTNRPAIGVRFPFPGGIQADVWTLHAFSGGGGDAPGFCNAIAGFSPNWFLAGDFNRAPATMPVPAGSVLCDHGPVNTHPGSGTNLDYAMKISPPGAVKGNVDVNFVVSDHFPVFYQL